MQIIKIDPNFNKKCFEILNVHRGGVNLMSKKTKLHFFLIKQIPLRAAIILKQEALSIGAELITNKDVLNFKDFSDAVLLANKKQLEILSKKLNLQDFGLKEIANFIKKEFLIDNDIKIMGVINVNNNSFNPLTRTSLKDLNKKISNFINDGASYIDIGLHSSAPGIKQISENDELSLLLPVLKEIKDIIPFANFSLDSYNISTNKLALDSGFKMINDISSNLKLALLAKEYKAKYVLMHNQLVKDALAEVDKFFYEFLEKIDYENVILDIGFGFKKSYEQNLILTKNLSHFLHFGHKLLFGASSKGTIGHFINEVDPTKRLTGSLYLNLKASEAGASILRVHNVKETKNLILMKNAFENINWW